MKCFLTATVLLALAPACLGQGSALLGQAGPAPPPPAARDKANPAGGNAGAASQAPEDKAPRFEVNVKLVNVFVTVVDGRGAPVGSLTRGNFQVAEDGVPQSIAVFDREPEVPLSIVLAIDASLSTRKDLKLELESARAFAHSILRPVDALSLYQFTETVEELVRFTSDLKRIDQGIRRVHIGSATALYDAMFLGAQALLDRRGRKVLVVITDGGDTFSKVSYQDALRAAQEAEAIVYSIVVVPIEASAGRNIGGEHALIQLARDTGGKHYYAESTPQLDQAFRHISDELRTQYLIAYYPKQRLSESEFRRIQVQVRPPGDGSVAAPVSVRHRAGYYTGKPK